MKNINKVINIEKISNNLIYLNKNKIVKILKVEPINFSLKSSEDKNSIILEYNNFLKKNDSNFQILIKSRKGDVENYIKNLKLHINNELIYEEYSNFILKFLDNKSFEIKEFYIILSEIYCKQDLNLRIENIKKNSINSIEYINKCGNLITDITSLNEKNVLSVISYLINERENYNYENIF